MVEETLLIKVFAGASSNKIGEIFVDASDKKWQKVYVTDIPEHGKANRSVIKLLSKQYKIPKSCFEIILGREEKYKIIKISCINK